MKWIKKVASTPLSAIAKVIDSISAQTNDRTNAPSIRAVRTAINTVSDEVVETQSDLSGVASDLSETQSNLSSLGTRVDELWKEIYPVGSIYLNVNDVNPALIFGGTWEKLTDRFLIGSGSSYQNGATGGATSDTVTPDGIVGGHSITVPELPPHRHGYYHNYKDTDPNFGYYNLAAGSTQISKMTPEHLYTNPLLGVWDDDMTVQAQSQAHTHDFIGISMDVATMPPYLAVNIWKRTA